MKKILLFVTIAFLSISVQAQTKPATKKQATTTQKSSTNDKSKDNIDDRMKGPKGEKVYIGEKGGRYYLKNGKKIYVEYKGSKKKTTTQKPG
jgi:maltose-binding protein MalE